MKELSKNDIITYLKEINDRLGQLNTHGEILIVGGAAMALSYDSRDSTYDIDAMFEPKGEMRNIIDDIAKHHNLNSDWLNDGVKGFMTSNMTGTNFLEMSNLTVKCLDAECLLAMKLTSAREFSKDMEDSIYLMSVLDIQKEEELFDIIDKYSYKNQKTPKAMYFTQEAFEKYSQLKSKRCDE